MLTLGLVCAKISAGAGYAIRLRRLRRRLRRFGRLVEVGGGSFDPGQPPPTFTNLRNLHRPPSSEAERHRRECDDKEDQSRPRKPATRRRQGPLRVENRRVAEATGRQDQPRPPPIGTPSPGVAQQDDEPPETEPASLLPA